jgi:hypothetical protein
MSAPSESGFHVDVRDDWASLRYHDFGIGFRRLGPRWAEVILGPGSSDGLARAFIVATDEQDPARLVHPVYQEAHLHRPEDGSNPCLLMTGRAFDHHFSAAISLASDSSRSSRIILDLDVADRCRSPVQLLSATYVLPLDSGALIDAAPDRVIWQVPDSLPGRLELHAVPPASLTLAEAGRVATRVQIVAPIQPKTFTHRLRYRWCWTIAEGLTR